LKTWSSECTAIVTSSILPSSNPNCVSFEIMKIWK
jgi:hypothetical protein